MPKKVVLFVAGTVTLAVCAVLGVFLVSDPTPVERWGSAAACMATLGFLAQVLAHRVRQVATGSIASIPYLAGAILVPDWRYICLILAVEIVVAALSRRPLIKSVFNVAQFVLSCAAAAIVYRLLGGRSPLEDSSFSLLPYAGAVLVLFFVNTFTVSGVLALAENRKLLTVWRQITSGTLLYDVLASPVAFLFAWVFASQGVWGAVFLAVPLLAVRQAFRTTWQLEQATQDLLQLMVKAIEARDPYTSGHSQRVQAYSVLIGRAAKLSNRECQRLGTAALLHDVGKIHEIYAPILRKPSRLTADEWAIMKTHPVKSAELVVTVSQLNDLVQPIRHHHENWDGTGYPDGLSGDAIPLWARIITLADTIDAMTTDRPYRQALSLDQVRSEIIALAGKQFDPALCDAVLESDVLETLSELLPKVKAVGTYSLAFQPSAKAVLPNS
jgi:hypothetical protein